MSPRAIAIHLNGAVRAVPAACRVAELLEALGYGGKRVAVELNGQIVPKSHYGSVGLRADDQVEIVVAVGGG